MQKITLPATGFQDGTDGPLLYALDVAVGERGEAYTDLFVRGWVRSPAGARIPFAGTTTIREGRSTSDHDIRILGPHPRRSPSRHGSFADDVALAVHLALDAHAEELVTAEMCRICG